MGAHMRELSRTRPFRLSLSFGAAVVALMLAWPMGVPAQAADARLESAQERRVAVQQRMDSVLGRLDSLQAATAAIEARVKDLRAQAASYQRRAHVADRLVEARVRDAYKRGEIPAAFALLTTEPTNEASERARLLSVLAVRHRAESEGASSARIRAAAAATDVNKAVAELERREAELDALRAEVAAALEEARDHEASVEQQIAAEIEARQAAARERAARQRSAAAPAAPAATSTSSDGGGGGGDAPAANVSGGIACPVGTPRSYSDTWGAPRSGGRSHLGTDILAPIGTPNYAYESGTITMLMNSSLGGISLYMRGASGNVYFYTHLSGYAATAREGKHVEAGELIAYGGDSGNAAGIPHTHFEVMPGGGSNVNPYPYVLRACG